MQMKAREVDAAAAAAAAELLNQVNLTMQRL